MTKRSIAAVLAAALTLSACGKDSTAPAALQVTETQAQDLMDALSAVGTATGLMQQTAAYRAGPRTALATVSVDESAPCPNGGTYRMQGSFNFNDAGTSATIAVTQGYSSCKATSSNGTLWTFNGAPNIVTNFSMTSNPSTGEFTMTGTEKGAVDAASTVGSGRCSIDVTYSASGNQTTGAMTVTVSGSVCGHSVTVQETI